MPSSIEPHPAGARSIGTSIVLGGLVPAAIGLAARYGTEVDWVSESLHSAIEVAGGCIAIGVALALVVRARLEGTTRAVWCIAALVAMGVLDLAHGAWPYGPAWSWLRALGTATGGVLFALCWLPARLAPRRAARLAAITAVAALAVVAVIGLVRDDVPVMWTRQGGYTLWTKGLNTIGGLGCVAASIYFHRAYRRDGAREHLVLASHTLLLGTASLLIWFSRNWHVEWWAWHSMRLLAYVVVAGAAYELVRHVQAGLTRRADELEAAVAARTEEQRAAIARAEAAVRLRDDFLSIASHELRTPLTALQLQLDTLDHPAAAEPERLARKLAVARRATARLGRLIDELLDVSRIATGRLALDREPFDLAALAAEVVERHAAQAQAAGCDVRVDAAPTPGTWDRARLDQVISNLLANAIKYGPGKPIELAVAPHGGGGARVRVRDHGIGIRDEDRARIFRRFERAVSSANYGGFGLGLYIAHEIVVAHGGDIEVAGQLGDGATFTVVLPAGEIDEPA